MNGGTRGAQGTRSGQVAGNMGVSRTPETMAMNLFHTRVRMPCPSRASVAQMSNDRGKENGRKRQNNHNPSMAPERGEKAGSWGQAHPPSTLAAPGEARGFLDCHRDASLVSFCKLLPDKKG